jgi:hypothetical protein
MSNATPSRAISAAVFTTAAVTISYRIMSSPGRTAHRRRGTAQLAHSPSPTIPVPGHDDCVPCAKEETAEVLMDRFERLIDDMRPLPDDQGKVWWWTFGAAIESS